MSETNAPEPTMEEILASIRRIISEDDAPASATAQASAPPGDPPHPPAPAQAEPAPHHEPPHDPRHEDVLELTERAEPEPESGSEPESGPEPAAAASPPAAALGDLDFAPVAAAPPPEPPRSAAAPTPPPAPAPTMAAPAPAPDEPLVGAGPAGRVADHFGALASSLVLPAAGRTLEDLTGELLRPLLKEWLDQNLAAIVEARVQDEVERISRRRSY